MATLCAARRFTGAPRERQCGVSHCCRCAPSASLETVRSAHSEMSRIRLVCGQETTASVADCHGACYDVDPRVIRYYLLTHDLVRLLSNCACMGLFADRCAVGARIPAGQRLVSGAAGCVRRARTRGPAGVRGAPGGRWPRGPVAPPRDAGARRGVIKVSVSPSCESTRRDLWRLRDLNRY